MIARQSQPGDRSAQFDNVVALPKNTRAKEAAEVRPLARTPKQLDAPPSLYQNGSAAMQLGPDGRRLRPGTAAPPPAGDSSAATADVARLLDLNELLDDARPDESVAQMSRNIARSLALRRRPRREQRERGTGVLAPMRYRYRSDDIDLDRTIEVLTEKASPDDTDIVVRERTRSRRAVALIVDVSGSMKGEKARMAAATVAALAGDLAQDELAVIAFWSDAALLKPLAVPMSTSALLDQMLRIPTRGLTNVEFGLTVAWDELRLSPARRRTAVLLTDALHNAGPDPRDVAGRFRELHVLLQTDGAHDRPLADDIARRGRGRLAQVSTYRDVAPALNRVFAE